MMDAAPLATHSLDLAPPAPEFRPTPRDPAPGLADTLRTATRQAHDDVEALPFSLALLQQRLPRHAYVGQLVLYRDLWACLETCFQDPALPAPIRDLWSADMVKTPLLDDDLEALGPVDVPADATCATVALCRWVETLPKADPQALAGVLYVLEGSTMGGVFMSRFLAEQYGLQDRGFRYYFGHGMQTAERWREVRARIDALSPAPADRARIIAAADQTFEGIGRILAPLHPAPPVP
jgi:heme oxygenase